MALTAIDWAIVAAYFLLSIGIGLYFTKRGGESLNEYFLSGRKVTWWLAGASMVATTFAADTPLVVTALVAKHGVAGSLVPEQVDVGVPLFVDARLIRQKTNALSTNQVYAIAQQNRYARPYLRFRELGGRVDLPARDNAAAGEWEKHCKQPMVSHHR